MESCNEEANSRSKECIRVELPAVASDDPLFQEKNDIIEQRCFSYVFLVPTSEAQDQCVECLDAMLKLARILNLNEVECYFLEDDDYGPFSPRNEFEALNLVLLTLYSVKNAKASSLSIESLVGIALDKLASFAVAEEILKPGIPCDGDKEKRLLSWAKSEGIKSKLDVAVFEGFGRGGRAVDDIAVGDVVLEIPQHAIICEDTILNTDMFPVLRDLKELTGETKALLWSMRERHDPLSKFAPYFASLPNSFNTGLSFGLSALKALDGTIVFEEILQAREHLRSQYDTLFPALSDLYPLVFPKEHFTWDMFLWACELWYSNGLKIAFPDSTVRTCLVPMAGLLNHGLYPHVTHYSKVDCVSRALLLRSVRPCKSGQQCFLNYGAFSNSHLLTFYGFILDHKNPFDIVPIDLDLSDAPDRLALIEKWKLGLSHMIRGSWLSTSQLSPFGLPTRLLGTLRVAFMDDEEARASFVDPRHEKVNTETEIKAYETLLSILSGMLDALGDNTSYEDEDTFHSDVGLAISFRDCQRKLLHSACEACSLALKALML